jgi:signal transduction histidine kinase
MLGLVGLVIGRVRHWLKRPTGTARERLLALAQLYEVGGFLAYLDDSRRAIAQMMLRCLFTAERLGPCPELAVTYMGWALTLALLRHRRLSARAATEAIRVSEEIGDRFTLARARVAQAWSIHVAGNPRAGEAAAVRALTEHAHWLDVHSYYIGCNDLVWNLLMRGYCREGWRWLQEGLLRAEEAGGQRESFAGSAAALTAVLGRTAEAQSYLERARRVGDEMPRERWWWMDLLGKETLVLLESNDLGLPLDDAIARRRELGLRPGSGSFHTHHFFVFQGYARLAQCLRSPRAQLTSRLLQLEDAVAELRRAAVHPTLRCHLLALIGALHDLRGEPEAALPTLDRAEAIANRYDNPWALFETFRARARLLRRQGDREAAGRQASFAYTLAAHHGWVTRSRWVRAEFQLDSVVYSSTSALDGSDREGTAPLEARSLKRQLDALLQVSLTTGTVLDPERQARVVLDEIIRILGAEHGFLFLVGAKDALELRAGRDAIGRDLAAAGDFSRAVLETVSTTLEPVIVSGDDRMARSLDGEGAMGPRSIVAAPLVLHGRFLGVVYVENRVARGTFSEDELAVLRALAVHIAIVIRIAEGFEATARLLDVVRRQVVDLQQSRQRITAAEERLKQEIAEMLHSRVQTRLLLAWHRLGGAIGRIAGDPQGAQEELSRIRDDIDDIREREIRQASHLLHPSIIRVGLVPAVRSLISRIGDQLALDLHVDPALAAADDPIENKLSEPLRLTVYRFIEEALANVQRHAKAGRVWLSLGLDGGEVVVVVRDDGVGFDVAARRSGLGLQSIADRVDQEGGTWSIESTPGAGTQLTARVPCELRETEESAAT